MASEHRRIVIIGSGFGGLGLGIRLKRAGINSFTILEKAASLGGTWRENTYPGAACDVPSMLYCFSFDQKNDWTRKWSSQAEIRAYMESSAQRNGILPHIRFGVEVAGATFEEGKGTWSVRTTTGEEIVADVLVSAVGQLHHPALPKIPGVEQFTGEKFHSASWNHGYDLTGKRVAVIGNAASAIQFIPEVAKQVAELLIFQRSANWMIPRNDRAYSEREQWCFANIPGLSRFYRSWLWCMHEAFLLPMIQSKPWATRMYTKAATDYMQQTITDPELRRTLTPDYPIGGKRVLISDDYYPALKRSNVRIVTGAIERISTDSVVTVDGAPHPVDAIIYATGFRTNPFLAPMHIEGIGGHRLEEDWSQGAHAYYGLTVAGYPNFFMMYGPNTNLGHNSIIFMLECQISYILSAVQMLIGRDLRYLDLRRDVMDAFNRQLQEALKQTAWAAAGQSWYKDEAGRITNNWPHSTAVYWWHTRHINLRDYRSEPRAAAMHPLLVGAQAATQRAAA
ncbi:MAG: NAD(P)/FAD-dependent oxidoreductase [Deltaproteobacteria bacterium]|nr:NAD(P)/FAD-dependent oxidoreductase [Deltaproteobacteria bacterium]